MHGLFSLLLHPRNLLRGTCCWLLVLLLAPSAAQAQKRGYVGRACGLDMNRNGIIGEPAGADPLVEPGDCNVCDGGPSHPTHPATGTPDPDGDGVDEDLIYVDAQAGNDSTGDGTALAPYRTVGFAFSMADGPADGAEDIICFRGNSQEINLSPPPGFRGLETTYEVEATGSEERSWLYPSHPAMLVGWDRDDDGCYPPYDDGQRDTARCGTSGDLARFHGPTAAAIRAFAIDPDVSYFEMAHFKVDDYGRATSSTSSGFIKFAASSTHEHLYLHDLELFRINGERSHDSSVIAIDLFNTNLHWVSFENLLFDENGGWFVRGVPHQGEGGKADAGPLRWQNITRIMLGDHLGATTSFKPWGYITGVEVLDSIWDLNVDEWTPLPGTGNATITFVIQQCNQDWVLRNNEIIDYWGGIRVDGASEGFCENADARPTENIVLDGNILRNTYSEWDFGHFGISIQGEDPGSNEGDVAGEVVGSVTITNNFLSSVGAGAWESCISAYPGNDAAPVPGEIKIINNTCFGPMRRDEGAGILIGATVDGAPQFQTFMQQRYEVKNNIIAGLADNDHNMLLGYIPQILRANFNIYDQAGRYALWIGGQLLGHGELAGWQTEIGREASSAECDPAFANASSGNFHLTGRDTCARESAQNQTATTPRDIDGDPRPASGRWDAGADDSRRIFADGFEAGNTALWSQASPGG